MINKSIHTILLVLFTINISFAQSQQKIRFNHEEWEVLNSSENLVSLDTTNRVLGKSDVVSISMLERLSGKAYSLIMKKLPLNIAGDTLTIRYKIKHENAVNRFELFRCWLYSYQSPEITSFVDTDTIININRDWQDKVIKLGIPKDSKELIIQLYNPSISGTVYLSDVNVLIDDKPYTLATKLKYAKDKDKEFDGSSKINVSSLTEKQIRNLALLCRYWGYLKYYHPNAGSLNYNFDFELFRLIPKVLNAKNQKQIEQIFINYLSALGDYETMEIEPAKEVLFSADYLWINTLKDAKLIEALEKLKKAKREFNSYVNTAYSGYPEFSENSYDNMDQGYRLLALFRYWNAVNYFYPYKNILSNNWNEVLAQSIPEFVNADTPLKYELAIMKLSAFINDTHAYKVYDHANSFFGENLNSAILKFVEGKPIVIGSVDNDTTNVLQKGDVILEVNGKTIDEIGQFYRPYFSSSNNRVFYRNLAYNLLRSQDSVLSVKFERGGQIITSSVVCDKTKKDIYGSTVFIEKKDNVYIKDSVLYTYIRGVDSDLLSKKLSDTTSIKGIIIDLRCYPTATPDPLLGYMFENDVPFIKFSGASITTPGTNSIVDSNQAGSGEYNPNYFKGKVVVLVDEGTQSFAEWMTMWFQAAPNVITIGTQTAGADGNVTVLPLPGGLETAFTGIGVFYPDGGQTQRVGVRIDETVTPTIDGFRAGCDEVLERAIEIIRKN